MFVMEQRCVDRYAITLYCFKVVASRATRRGRTLRDLGNPTPKVLVIIVRDIDYNVNKLSNYKFCQLPLLFMHENKGFGNICVYSPHAPVMCGKNALRHHRPLQNTGNRQGQDLQPHRAR